MKGLESTIQTLKSWMASACETLAIILNQGVYPEPDRQEILNPEALTDKGWSGILFPVGLFGGLEGEFSVLLNKQDASVLIDLLVGGSGNDSNEEMTQLHQSVLQEAMQQLVSGLSDQLTTLKGQAVKVRLSQSTTQLQVAGLMDDFLWWECPLSLDEGPGFTLTILCPKSFVEQFAAPAPAAPAAAAKPSSGFLSQFAPVEEDDEPSPIQAEKPRFQELKPAGESRKKGQLDLILDVKLQVQVVLGRTSMMVQDLIHLGEGSILELDKLAGEPVELMVHDRLVAYGEVIVVDERFGVKVLELVADRRNLRPAI